MQASSTSDLRHVLNYAIKFEQAYAARDWSLIAPCFTPEATYVVSGAEALAGVHAGREAVLNHFAGVTDAFDRRFDAREVIVLDGPAERDGGLWFRWATIYHLAGAPDLRMEGESQVTLSGDEISRLEDRITPEEGARVVAYFQQYGTRFLPAQ